MGGAAVDALNPYQGFVMSRSRDGMFAAMRTEKFLKVPILYWKWEIT